MQKSRADRALVILIAVLFVAFLVTIRDAFQEKVVVAGDRAPSFSITTDDGKRISTSDFGGKLLVLNFWATWCPPCVEEMPSLNAFAQQMRGSGVVVLGVSVDKNEATYKRFLSQAGLAFPTARDEKADISTDYGTFRWPETYIIDREGRVLQKHIGPRDWMSNEILTGVKALL